jgi:hypothetical protein
METEISKPIPILEIAWTRFAQFDVAAIKRSRAHIRTRFWLAFLGVLAALFAILSQIFPRETSGLLGFIFRVFLILTPIVASVLAAIAAKNYSGGDWLIKRAGAEEILKEIYTFRTILQKSPTRRNWLENRLNEIQRQVFRGLGGELTMKAYEGPLPSIYYPDDPNSDPGFHDLTGEEYYRYRLIPQLEWHRKEAQEYQAERSRLTWLILLFGGAGAFVAAWDQTTIWVALTAAFTAAFIGWQELRNVDTIIRNYSKVIMELEIIHNHWNNLEPEERSSAEFFKMVRSTEEILWSQNMEYIKSMQEALKESDLEEKASLINRVIQESVDADARLKRSIEAELVEHTRGTMDNAEESLSETFSDALGTLAEEASSEIVQGELAAMGQYIEEAAQELAERAASGFSSTLQAIKDEFEGVDISRDTPPAVLNQLLSRYPKSNDVKG